MVVWHYILRQGMAMALREGRGALRRSRGKLMPGGQKAPASGASLEQAWVRSRCRAIVVAKRAGAGLGRYGRSTSPGLGIANGKDGPNM